MKLKVLLFFTFLFAPVLRSAAEDIAAIRLLYIKAVESSAAADELLERAKKAAPGNALMLAYQGAAEALIAKHSWNPYTKMKYLNRSQETLAKAVNKSPENPEIRFLRFSIQHYVPAFLGQSGNLEEDKKAILRNLDKTSGKVRQVIVRFLKESGRCSADELKQLGN